MRNTFLLLLSLIFLANPLIGQTKADKCEVYLVDVKAAQEAFDEYLKNGPAKPDALSKAAQTLGKFDTEIGEEVLTTRHFAFPNSRLIITASVFYTDESFGARKPGEKVVYDTSILLGLVVAKKEVPDAIHAQDNAVAEATYSSDTLGARVKKLLTVDGREYLLGLQCLCNGAVEPNAVEK